MRAWVAVLLWSATAWPFANIVVDGKDADWAGTQTCFTKPVGVNPGSSIQLNRVCMDNNNTTGNNGFLFSLYESNQNYPTNTDIYFGFEYDSNNDGVINASDLVYAIHFPAGAKVPDSLQVFTAVNFNPVRTYNSTADCGGPAGANGWSGALSSNVTEMRVAYGCLGLSATNENRLFELGTYPTFDVTYQAKYNGGTGQLIASPAPSDVSLLVAESGVSQTTLVWNNPQIHDGVTILRAAGAAPNTAPTSGTAYPVGTVLGNAKVVYHDTGQSAVHAYTDTGADLSPPGLVNGTRYYYKVYSVVGLNSFASGNVPSTSGTFSTPTSRVYPSPLWCYTEGLPAMTQPVVDANASVYSAGNLGAITANLTSGTASLDGTEKWRPVLLKGPVQNRFPAVPLFGQSGKFLLAADQSGFAYAVNAGTGQTLWTANGGVALGTAIQGQPVVQLNQYANAAFKSAHPNHDLVFVGTRNASATTNEVFALNSVTGAIAWTYNPRNLDIINGGMLVDYTANQLVVASRSNGGRQASLRFLNSLTGASIATLSLGDIDTGVNRDFVSQQAYVANVAGTVYGVGIASHAQVWSASVGAQSAYPYPIGNGFIASLTAGSVQRWDVSGMTPKLTWSTAVAGPSGVVIDYARQKVLVGSSDGKLHQLDVATGVDGAQVQVAANNLGTPSIDATASRVMVGTLDGRVCAFALPLH